MTDGLQYSAVPVDDVLNLEDEIISHDKYSMFSNIFNKMIILVLVLGVIFVWKSGSLEIEHLHSDITLMKDSFDQLTGGSRNVSLIHSVIESDEKLYSFDMEDLHSKIKEMKESLDTMAAQSGNYLSFNKEKDDHVESAEVESAHE
eukprot:UN24397